MINFKLAYFDKHGVATIYLIENAQCLPSIGGNIIVYHQLAQQSAIVTDIVHFYNNNKAEIVVYADSKERLDKKKDGAKYLYDLDLSVRLFNSLRGYFSKKGYKGDISEMPISELAKISMQEFFESRFVGNKSIAELESALRINGYTPKE